jgi:hypothetical protein
MASETAFAERFDIVNELEARTKNHPPAAKPVPAEAAADRAEEGEPSPDELGPLPKAEAAYVPHSRMSNRPLPTLYFLAKNQLPDGFSYSCLERVRMVDAEKPGESPHLLVLFNGHMPQEVRIEGRNLLKLCNDVGRHLVHWIRQHPTGHDSGDDKAVFIRRIHPDKPKG